MFFSIITSTLNASAEIGTLADSIISQSFQDYEWLIADGGSVDHTIDIVKKFDCAKIVANCPDSGIYNAWNKALHVAEGHWILFLGADDRLADSESLADAFEVLSHLPDHIGFVHGKVISGDVIIGRPLVDPRHEMAKNMAICHQATFHRREMFKAIGGYDEQFKIAGDYEYVLRAIQGAFEFVFIDRLIAEMGQNGLSSNPLNGYVSAIEALAARRNNNFPLYNTVWLKHFLKGTVLRYAVKVINPNDLRKLVAAFRRVIP